MVNFVVPPKPLVLLVLDGFGIAPEGAGNAVTEAKTPNLDEYWQLYPHAELRASGEHVGLYKGLDGNSEVGHLTIGAGRISPQELIRINNSIKSSNFYKNRTLVGAVDYVKETGGYLHIIGLVGGGKVHSSIDHAKALIDLCVKEELNGNRVLVHIITDGRDSDPHEAEKYISELEEHMSMNRIGNISTVIGRHYAMDKNERWERTEEAYDLYTKAEGTYVKTWQEAIKKSYKNDINDQYIEPHVVLNYDTPFPVIERGDSVIFFNYRGDRAVQLTRMFEDNELNEDRIDKVYFAGMADYEDDFPKKAAFPHVPIHDSLGEILSKNKVRQLRIAESEKYPDITYFFNGGREEMYPGEDRIEVMSPKDVETYDESPEMSLEELTKKFIEKVESNHYDFILVNIANADMVSHTGNLDATIKGIEFMDEKIKEMVDVVLEKNGAVLITSDHGNAEEMYTIDGEIDTKHSTNSVPLFVIKKFLEPEALPHGTLADVAPTILGLLGIKKPAAMTGKNLL